jgi:hypothetical protein
MFRRIRSCRISGAMVVALAALFVSLGGLGYAKQIANLIDGHQIKKGSIEADRLSKKARSSLRGQTGSRGRQGNQGAQGPKGSTGTQGPAGSAVAYAKVTMTSGSVTLTASKNISQSQVSAATSNPGVVCFHNLNFTVKNMVASPVAVYGFATYNRVFVSVGPNSTASGCPSGTPPFNNEAFVTAYDASTFNSGPREFPYTVDVWFQ